MFFSFAKVDIGTCRYAFPHTALAQFPQMRQHSATLTFHQERFKTMLNNNAPHVLCVML